MRMLVVAGTLAGVVCAGCAHATNGYFAHGYGIRAKAMGGCAIGTTWDSLAPASNPAAIAFVGNRVDVGVDWFQPTRHSRLSPALFGPAGGVYGANDAEHFFIPEFGVTWQAAERLALGLAVYGNGGMNTNYGSLNRRTRGLGAALFGAPPDNGLLGRGQVGVDMAQMFVAPTVAVKVHPRHALGVSAILAAQRFEARGLHNFANSVASVAPNSVTNRGHDWSYGYGFHIGWTGRLTDGLTVGASWQSRIWMTPFSRYNGLFAEGGDFDIPDSYGIGFTWKPLDRLTLAGEIQRIRYDHIDSVAHEGNRPAQLGSDGGPGFGWRDMTVWKLGLAWEVRDDLTFMAGGSFTDHAPYRGTETFFNILAPGVVRTHLTFGFTWRVRDGLELSAYYAHAFANRVEGRGRSFGIDNDLAEDMIGVGVGLTF